MSEKNVFFFSRSPEVTPYEKQPSVPPPVPKGDMHIFPQPSALQCFFNQIVNVLTRCFLWDRKTKRIPTFFQSLARENNSCLQLSMKHGQARLGIIHILWWNLSWEASRENVGPTATHLCKQYVGGLCKGIASPLKSSLVSYSTPPL